MKSDKSKTLSTAERNEPKTFEDSVNRNNEKLAPLVRETNSISQTAAFEEIIAIIERARENAFRAVNRELISMYWEIGSYISGKVKRSGWGRSIVSDFARFIQREKPGINGFSASNIWRMRQFYETYSENEKLAPLVREISWTQNLLIMARAKSDEAREFYLLLCSKNNYSKRELERQIDSMLWV